MYLIDGNKAVLACGKYVYLHLSPLLINQRGCGPTKLRHSLSAPSGIILVVLCLPRCVPCDKTSASTFDTCPVASCFASTSWHTTQQTPCRHPASLASGRAGERRAVHVPERPSARPWQQKSP